MTVLLSTPDLDEFIRLAHLDLTGAQTADLLEILHLQSTGKWRWPEWRVDRPHHGDGLVVARALVGLLILDERILWTAQARRATHDAFRRALDAISRFWTPTDEPGHWDLGGITIKIRCANGDEQIARTDTGNRIQFVSRHHPGATRGYVADLAIVEDADQFTDRQRLDLLPTMAARPNPQIVYA